MGAISHAAIIRRVVNGSPDPPVSNPGRDCRGTTTAGGFWHHVVIDDRRVREWVDEYETDCGSGCSKWLPEAPYCAHHMPIDLIYIVEKRAALWARLAVDVWEEVCAEYPIPDTYDET